MYPDLLGVRDMWIGVVKCENLELNLSCDVGLSPAMSAISMVGRCAKVI